MSDEVDATPGEPHTFTMAVLGRMLEHLGVQLYKRRDTAIAELVANAWDAGATNIWIELPGDQNYSPLTSEISIEDDGSGMSAESVQDAYLVLGRNRRRDSVAGDDGYMSGSGRRIMGRKGIGKLAGFGIADQMTLETWQDSAMVRLPMNIEALKLDSRSMSEIELDGQVLAVRSDARSPSGTRLILRRLKHQSSIDPDTLKMALSRRFSRSVRGQMSIFVNREPIGDPVIDWHYQAPSSGDFEKKTLLDGQEVRVQYGFSKKVLPPELQGFTIMVHGKTAQAPPFFFNVENSASGQHGTKYLTGVIEADFLDDDEDDESDVVSTDRQEIDWETAACESLRSLGEKLVRTALAEFRDFKRDRAGARVKENERVRDALKSLDKESAKTAEKMLGVVGLVDTDQEREIDLALAIINALRYQHFHDVVDEIERAAESSDPAALGILLEGLVSWGSLEGQALLTIVRGRLAIIELFHQMINVRAPETAPALGASNLHDLLARFPWLLGPDLHFISEETSLKKRIEEIGKTYVGTPKDGRRRYDLLALSSDAEIVVVELKRPGDPMDEEDVWALDTYYRRLKEAEARPVRVILVSHPNLDEGVREMLNEKSAWLTATTWNDVHSQTKRQYDHYSALIEGRSDDPKFGLKVREASLVEEVLAEGSYRGPVGRAKGFGPQDVDYEA